MSVTQSTFEVLRNTAYAGMPATGRYQNIDGSQLTAGKVNFGDPVSMGVRSRTITQFDKTRPFAGIAVRNFYMGDGAVGEVSGRAFDAAEKHWDIDCGVLGDWWVPVSNDCENGQQVTITPEGKFAGGLIPGNFILEGATFKTAKSAKGLAWIELTGSRRLTLIKATRGGN